MGTVELMGLIRYAPIVTTAIVIAIIEFALRGTMAFSLAPAFALIVASVYHGGARAGIVSGLLVSGYAIYASPDIGRTIIIILSIIAIVGPMILMRRTIDNGDRVLSKLMDTDIYLAGAVHRWHSSTDKERSDLIKEIHHQVAHIRTLARGWHDLSRERERVIDDYKPKT